MAPILDDIDELEREIVRLRQSKLAATPEELLSVMRRLTQMLRRVAERQEQPR